VSTPEELQGQYARGEERDRLLSPFGQVELARTSEILERTRPPSDLEERMAAPDLRSVVIAIPPARSSEFPSFRASARTFWRRHDATDLCLGSGFARLRGRARRARGL